MTPELQTFLNQYELTPNNYQTFNPDREIPYLYFTYEVEPDIMTEGVSCMYLLRLPRAKFPPDGNPSANLATLIRLSQHTLNYPPYVEDEDGGYLETYFLPLSSRLMKVPITVTRGLHGTTEELITLILPEDFPRQYLEEYLNQTRGQSCYTYTWYPERWYYLT